MDATHALASKERFWDRGKTLEIDMSSLHKAALCLFLVLNYYLSLFDTYARCCCFLGPSGCRLSSCCLSPMQRQR